MSYSKSTTKPNLAKRDLILKSLKKRSGNATCSLLVPSSFSVSYVLCSKANQGYLCLYNNVFKLSVPIPTSYLKLSFEKTSGSLSFKSYLSNIYHKQYVKQINALLSSFHSIFFKKLKFKGKGYYIYKNARNTVAPQFGYSHRVYVYSWFTNIKFLGKTSLVIFGLKSTDIKLPTSLIKSFRPINIFTGRGVRFSREIVYSKPGKVSSYR
jgi:ribosomal protein L6P/L9E